MQLYSGAGSKWDAHSKMESNHSGLCKATDKPIAGLLQDLKQRGLLKDTLVVWGGEFGRTPKINRNYGRDHWGNAWSVCVGGAGIDGHHARERVANKNCVYFAANSCRMAGFPTLDKARL